MKNLRQVWILLLFVLLHLVGDTQQENKTGAIAAILKGELKKANLLVESSNIQLVQLTAMDAKKYELDEKPADAFYIKTTSQLINIRSRSIEGLRNGVYWYLQYLGFRYYFPGEAWQYTPHLKNAFRQVEKTISPSFTHRRIWYAYGTGSKQADADYKEWFNANLLGGEDVNAGHSYDGIVNRNKDVFLQHPEYFAQKVAAGKTPPDPKFEISNEGLVQLVIKDAFEQIEATLKKTGQPPTMISMDPSDGGGFSKSAASLKTGGPSEQTFYLANQVAKAARVKYPAIKIGLYAYNLHAAPPRFELEPNIVVLVATAMNQSAYRTDELINLWKKNGVQVGIRDYYGVMAWDWDMPGQVNGGKLAYVKKLKEYYNTGIRFFSAETNIGWISRGLGQYIAAQLLWDVKADPESIKAEFFKNMFSQSASEIEQLFQLWQSYKQAIPLDGDLHQWIELLESASKRESDKKVQQRITHIKQYLHYVYLFKKWRQKNTDDNLVQLLNFAYRIQDAGIVASYPLFRRLANSAVDGKANMRFNDPKAIWKQNNTAVSQEETERFFYTDRNSLNRSEKIEVAIFPDKFKQKKETDNKVLSENLKSSKVVRLRGGHKIVFNLKKGNASINLSTGLIKAYQYKTLRLVVYPYNNKLQTDGLPPVLTETIQPKQPLKTISLSSLEPGTYIAIIDDTKNGFTMSFTGDVSYAIVASSQNKIWTFSRNNLVFEVEGIKEFKVKNDGVMTLHSPTARVIDLQKQKGIITIQVQKGEEGIWKLQRQSGTFYLQGVLPFVNSDSDFLLRHEK